MIVAYMYISVQMCILVVLSLGVLKKSSSGRALQFITDEGVVYQLSVSLFDRVMRGLINGDFVVLSRMPVPVPVGRFPKSPVYGDSGVASAVANGGVDAFGKDFLVERAQQRSGKKVSDFRVDW